MINLIITIALIILAIVLVNKKLNAQLVFLFLGFLLALGITVTTGTSVANSSTGNLFLDIFEGLKEHFVSGFTSTGMAILPIYAYSNYMNKIGASQAMGELIAKPIANSKNPYLVGTFITIMIIGVSRIAIVSAFAIMALFLSTLYPALTKAGMSRQSAISAIFLATCFDWGPADFVIAQMAGGIEGFSVTDYFVNASIRVVPFVLILTALVSGPIFQFIDKKSGYQLGDHRPAEEVGAAKSNVPKFYAILPLLPLFIILLFSPIFKLGITVSPFTAVTVSVVIVFLIDLIRRKDFRTCFNEMQSWFAGMGPAYANIVSLLCCVQYFAAMLNKLNGFTYLVNAVLGAGVNGFILLVIFGLLMFVASLGLGGGGVVAITLAPQLSNIASILGISMYAAFLPMQIANGCRSINLGTSAHMQYVVKESQSPNAIPIVVRCLPPFLIMYAASFILSLIIL